MDLPTAIREGAKLRPQCVGSLFLHTERTGQIGSCALGAAYEALTGSTVVCSQTFTTADERAAWKTLRETWPELRPDLDHHIASLSDNGWTRERVADWVEQELRRR